MDTKHTPSAEERIVKILEVVDTRRYEEVEPDVWKPIPGTGIENECDRCNKIHEVHVRVLLDSGRQAIIGTGCARNETMDVQSRIKSSVSAVMTVKRLTAELDKLKVRAGAYEAREAGLRLALGSRYLGRDNGARSRIRQIKRECQIGYRKGQMFDYLVLDDVEVEIWEAQQGKADARDYQFLEGRWIEKRLQEAGFTGRDSLLKEMVKDLEKRICRAQAKVEGGN